MKKTLMIAFTIVLSFQIYKDISAMNTYIPRNEFFKDVVGIDEKTFREAFGWKLSSKELLHLSPETLKWVQTPSLQRGAPPKPLAQWISKYPRRAAIFAGNVEINSLQRIHTTLRNIQSPLLGGNPRFTIQVYNPENPTLTDIRSLVALPENKNAAFQVASSFFGMLEKDIDNPAVELNAMLKDPHQGEEISIATAPATIYRKYFAPQPFLLRIPGQKIKLLTNNKGHLAIDFNSILNYSYDKNDAQHVPIGLHEGAVVSNGPSENPFTKPSLTDKQLQIPINTQPNGTIEETTTHTVTLLFTSAFSIRGRENLAQNTNVKAFCQMLLDASYEATLKKVALTQRPKIFLTLLGAGAPANPIGWVADALDKDSIKTLIKNYGIDVTLVYQSEKVSPRSPQTDAQFLERMFSLADTINGTKHAQNPRLVEAISNYTAALYANQKEFASSQARLLMNFQQGELSRNI
ncbi:hypothetical protein H0X06_02260 [Candidatus Dependentiae bacterium]|nr:hypothetical protein [Candidatus Dependentiae bacterium]